MVITAVVFDLFDTLTVPYAAARWQRAVAGMAEASGVARAAFVEAWGHLWEPVLAGGFPSITAAVGAVCRSLGCEPSAERLAAAATCWTEGFSRPSLALRREALPALRALRATGTRVGLLSDSPPDVPALWRDLPAATLVDAAIFSCAARAVKPAPALYTLVCEGLGVAPADCLYVADGVGRELTGAAAAGLTPVLFRPSDAVAPDIYRADALEWRGPVITSLEEVPALLW